MPGFLPCLFIAMWHKQEYSLFRQKSIVLPVAHLLSERASTFTR